ncbi:MAG: 30S ribosomal protein S6 [bacterium]
MRPYETMFVLAPTLDAEGAKREVDALKDVVRAIGGEVTAEKEWGRRRLAYPIRDHSEGIYEIVRFSADPSKLAELYRHYKLNENVLRALVLRDEGTPLEYVGQPSESDDDYSRDRRSDGDDDDFRGPRRGRRPRSSDDDDFDRQPAGAGSGAGREDAL